jgi:DNA polymerase (family 10)
LCGAAVNIRPDGTLEAPDELLDMLDFVGAGIETNFDQPRSDLTARMARALENPRVDVLLHPTNSGDRERRALDADFNALIDVAGRTGTALEIDAQPRRFDLREGFLKGAVDAGVKLLINSDASAASELGYPERYGLSAVRRAWAARDSVLNTLAFDQFLQTLKPRFRFIAKQAPRRRTTMVRRRKAR